MKKGFSLIEVMIALCILMVSAMAFFRMHMVCTQARAYADCLTRATVLGSSRMLHLDSLPATAPDLTEEWHQDPGNPITDSGMQFYRFWIVRNATEGKEATVYVAWSDRTRARASNFASEEEIVAARCPKVSFNELLVSGE